MQLAQSLPSRFALAIRRPHLLDLDIEKMFDGLADLDFVRTQRHTERILPLFHPLPRLFSKNGSEQNVLVMIEPGQG